jgi:hypothetical protein
MADGRMRWADDRTRWSDSADTGWLAEDRMRETYERDRRDGVSGSDQPPPVRRVATSLPVGQPAAFGAAVRRSMAQAQRRAADAAGRHARNESVGAASRFDGFNERRFGRSA